MQIGHLKLATAVVGYERFVIVTAHVSFLHPAAWLAQVIEDPVIGTRLRREANPETGLVVVIALVEVVEVLIHPVDERKEPPGPLPIEPEMTALNLRDHLRRLRQTEIHPVRSEFPTIQVDPVTERAVGNDVLRIADEERIGVEYPGVSQPGVYRGVGLVFPRFLVGHSARNAAVSESQGVLVAVVKVDVEPVNVPPVELSG